MIKYSFLFGILLTFLTSSLSIYSNDIKGCQDCGTKCGTHLTFTSEGREYLQRTIEWRDDEPAVGHRNVISPSGKFKIHFDTTGVHAPPMLDKNQNNIPDYVDSVCYYFDYVFDIYINELGFRSPYPDRGGRGSDHYDVYLYDIGNSDDDTSVSDYSYGGTYGITYWANSDYISSTPFSTNYTYIIIDNDFAATDSIRPKGGKTVQAFRYPGIPSMKVTVAHEFFHAIQFMYGASHPGLTVMEMNAVAMEFVFFPEVKDYLQYVRGLFKNPSIYPFGIDDAFTGYGHSIFNKYLIEKFGIGIMRLMWEKVSEGNEVYTAIDLSLKDYGSSMRDAWCEFLEWAYHTGNRSIEGKYFSNAEELPEVEPFSNIFFSPPSNSTSGVMAPLEFRMLRFYFPASGDITDDTLDIMMANLDINSATRQLSVSKNYFWRVADNEITNSNKLDRINYWIDSEIDPNFICSNLIVKPGGRTVDISYAYPNPFRKNIDIYMLFPAPEKSELYSKLLLVVYNSEMHQIYADNLQVTVNNQNKVLVWDKIPSEIASGVYIFGIHDGDNVTIGKFVVIND
ncbi:MAG: hypothetical protein KIT33_09740 [Candidatus Kapabacteria bacterium]|nr:hypothetical protein [Ignavibacteriota bacterium]MCW5885239.1 hypothetical protein [Candidatus Kapabacteria bacterium]